MLISRKPNGNNGFEALGAGQIGSNPDLLEYGQEFRLLVLGFWAGSIFYFFAPYGVEVSEAADSILAVEVAVAADFIKDFSFFDLRECLFVTQPNGLKVLFFGLWTHINNPFVGLPFNMSQRFCLNRRWVTFNLSQLARISPFNLSADLADNKNNLHSR